MVDSLCRKWGFCLYFGTSWCQPWRFTTVEYCKLPKKMKVRIRVRNLRTSYFIICVFERFLFNKPIALKKWNSSRFWWPIFTYSLLLKYGPLPLSFYSLKKVFSGVNIILSCKTFLFSASQYFVKQFLLA